MTERWPAGSPAIGLWIAIGIAIGAAIGVAASRGGGQA
jgi:hypothetical protein